jgi:NitT/TauT family transport system substrate-binding protein
VRNASRRHFLTTSVAAGAAGLLRRPASAAPKIRVGAVANESFAEPFYCADHGAFGRAGLDVEIVTFAGANVLQQALAGNAIDVGIIDVIQLSNAINHGLPFRYFAGSAIMSSTPTTLLSVSKNGAIRRPQDLEGQTIGVVTLHSANELAVREWLKRNGVDDSTVRFVELTGAAMGPTVLRGTVAATMLMEPFLSLSGDELRPLGNVFGAVANEFLLNGWYARTEWLDANAPVIPALTQAIYDTARWANVNHAASAPIFAKWAKMDLGQVNAMRRANYATSLDVGLLQPVINLAVKYKSIERAVPPANLIYQRPG